MTGAKNLKPNKNKTKAYIGQRYNWRLYQCIKNKNVQQKTWNIAVFHYGMSKAFQFFEIFYMYNKHHHNMPLKVILILKGTNYDFLSISHSMTYFLSITHFMIYIYILEKIRPGPEVMLNSAKHEIYPAYKC